MNIYKKLDILGQSIGFEENDSTKFRTWQGATLTLMVLTVCSVIGFLFGQEVYERKQAIVKYSKYFVDTSSVEVKQFPLLFAFSLRNGTIIKNPLEYVNLNFELRSFNEKNAQTITKKPLMHNCKAENLPSFNTLFKSAPCDNNGCFCPDPNENLSFANAWSAINSQYLYLTAWPCDKNKQKCADDLDSMLENFFMITFNANSYIDSNNYEDPIRYYLDTQPFLISTSYYKRIFLTVTNNTFISENGWLLENYNTTSYTQTSEIKTEMITRSPAIPYIGAFTFTSSRLVDKINRSYMKVQDLAAKLGGMINAMFILVNLISYSYLRFLYIANLYLLTKKVEEVEVDKYQNESSINPVKLNNCTQSKLNDGIKVPNIKLKNQNQEHKLNPTKDIKNKIEMTPQNVILSNNINEAKFSSDGNTYFNYAKYLKSFFTFGEYHKNIDKIIKLTKDKMSIETLTRAMNYFYVC